MFTTPSPHPNPSPLVHNIIKEQPHMAYGQVVTYMVNMGAHPKHLEKLANWSKMQLMQNANLEKEFDSMKSFQYSNFSFKFLKASSHSICYIATINVGRYGTA